MAGKGTHTGTHTGTQTGNLLKSALNVKAHAGSFTAFERII
jgi:hypothetical protein